MPPIAAACANGTVLATGAYRGTTLDVVRGDVTTFPAASVVNAANTALRGGGGVDGMIHRAAGPALLAELTRLYPGGGQIGSAYPSGAHAIRTTTTIIHAVGPDYRTARTNACRDQATVNLHNAYTNSLAVAVRAGARTIAFPTISTGVFAFPRVQAATIAATAVRTFLDGPGRGLFDRITFLIYGGNNLDEAHYINIFP
jgi:O-acetyl-ADP-ribose deacetylase (regulator of RNase III)